MTPNALFWLTFGPALAAAVAALLADAFGVRGGRAGTLAATALLAVGGAVGLVGGWANQPAAAFRMFYVGGGYSTTAGLVLALSAMALVGSIRTRFGSGGQGAALVALAALGSGLAAASSDLLVTLLSLETTAVSAYALVALGRTRAAQESAFKYFVQGAVASGLMLLGTVALAVSTGGDLSYRSFASLPQSLGTGLPVLGAALLIVVALAFKVSAAPFHSWAPDAYQHAPVPAAAVLAGPIKLASLVALAGFLLSFENAGVNVLAAGSLASDLVVPIAVLAALSVALGSLTALSQKSYRRMLGYAGVAQVGYGLLALAAFNRPAAVVHLGMYSVASVTVFLAASAFAALRPGWDGSIAGLAGLGRRHPVLGASVTVALASLAGLPPFAGFWGKLQAFGAPINTALITSQQGMDWAAWMYGLLALAGMVGSVISLAYYGAVVKELFFGDCGSVALGEDAENSDQSDVARPASGVVFILAFMLLAGGLAPLAFGLSRGLQGFLLVR